MESEAKHHEHSNDHESVNYRRSDSKDNNNNNNNNVDREIDQDHLADLLRKSANMVERGEFGSILYEALQDFRVYYKQKYPKNHRRKKKTVPPHQTATTATVKDKELAGDRKATQDEAESCSGKADTVNTTTATTADTSEESGNRKSSGQDQGQTMDADENKVFEAANSSAALPVEEKGGNHEKDHHSSSEFSKATTDTQKFVQESSPSPLQESNDDNETDDIPVATPIFTADVSAVPPSSTAENLSKQHLDRNDHYTTTSKPFQAKYATASTTNTAATSGKGNIFGKLKGKVGVEKLGATLSNVKKAALNVAQHAGPIHRNNNSSSREECQLFEEKGIDMAVSSGRRTSVENHDDDNFRKRTSNSSWNAQGSARFQNNARSHEFNSEQFLNGRSTIDHDGQNQQQEQQDNPQHARSNSYQQQQKQQQREDQSQLSASVENPSGSNDTNDSNTEPSENIGAGKMVEKDGVRRPGFQQPNNKSSSHNIIANGWVEQFRRSKFQHKWKDVLASLVEGQKPGEVTTLWIQRETVSSMTGRTELEALHRIPLHTLDDVFLQENASDNQFHLRMFNSTDDIVFRCADAPNDAIRWVNTLKHHQRLSKKILNEDEKKSPEASSTRGTSSHEIRTCPEGVSTKGMPIRELRAICHGAGINTANMLERSQLEAAAEEVRRRGTYFNQSGEAAAAVPTTASSEAWSSTQQHEQVFPPNRSQSPVPPQHISEEQPKRLGIKELRAICHGAGINTNGMERKELEAAAKEVESRGRYGNPPPGMYTPSQVENRARHEEQRRQQRQSEELNRRKEYEAAAAAERHRREVEEAQRRAAEEEARRRAAEEEARRRAAEKEALIKAAEEEARRRAAIEEQKRRQREAQAAQARYAQQQAAWQRQQQIEEQQRRAAEQKAAEERRRREEVIRKQQQWAAPAPDAHPQSQKQHYYHHQQQRQPAYTQQQQYQQQYHQQQTRTHTPTPPQPPPHQQQQPPPQQQRHSGSDNKYAKMANQSADDGQAAITKIKHGILIQWALQPPQLQMLRPVPALVTTIHNIFPPAFGVAGHDYFSKWKPITRNEVTTANGLPDDAKLKKMVRKIRFFLHPDKLPHDLNEEQKFMVKMLWDVTNDAWEEHQKSKEALDWIH